MGDERRTAPYEALHCPAVRPSVAAAQTELDADVLMSGRALATSQIMFHTQVAEVLGLSISDYRCLEVVLRSAEPVTAGTLAEQSGLTTGAVTGVIDRLERAGYVNRVRDAHDRRRVLVRAVPEAMGQYLWIFEALTARFQGLAAEFSPAELDVVRRYHGRVREILLDESVRLRDSGHTTGREYRANP